jgi:hypothetical protein
MADNLLSPGSLIRENDNSFLPKQPIELGAAIIGPTVKGPVEIPTIVTSYNEYKSLFGSTLTSGSEIYSYFTSIAAYNYFNSGGKSLLVSRVVSGSYTSADSTPISASISASSQPVFTLQTISKGALMNSSGSEDSAGSLTNGNPDNLRWEIVSPDSSSGTFTLLIRSGNDTTNNKIILESFTNLSLDPKSSNFISKVIGDYTENYSVTNNQVEISGSYPNSSRFVRVKSVNLLTPDYFDNNGIAKAIYTSSLPLVGSGSFTGATGQIAAGVNFYQNINATNTQGLTAGNYTNMVNLMANKNDYKYNMLLTPGIYDTDYSAVVTNIISNTQQRGDNIYVTDLVPYGATISSVTSAANIRNSSYAATYWPWVQLVEPDSGKNVWVPASTVIGGVYAYTDEVAAPWWAPAGISRGTINVIRPERKLNQDNKDTLYLNKVNPIANIPNVGLAVYGQKTLQSRASATDRVNVRRLIIDLKDFVQGVADNLVFEPNTIATRNQFISKVNPYFENVQQRQGLYAFKVIMDDTNNTADVIDRNQLVGQVYIQPTKTSEFIYIDFNITPTGASFPTN